MFPEAYFLSLSFSNLQIIWRHVLFGYLFPIHPLCDLGPPRVFDVHGPPDKQQAMPRSTYQIASGIA